MREEVGKNETLIRLFVGAIGIHPSYNPLGFANTFPKLNFQISLELIVRATVESR
jgi:hypothetical protein